MAGPLLTVGIVSCNRLHYLRALLESMRTCLSLEPIECIVVDNASIEPGLREYVEGVDFIRHRVFRDSRSPATEAAEALNTILELASARQVLLLTDDVQFIVRGDRWLHGVLEMAADHPELGSIMPIALRRVTIRRYFQSGIGARLFPAAVPRRIRTRDGAVGVICFPKRELGITHSALGVTPLATWRAVGPFRTSGARQTMQDAGAGTEEDVVRRYRQSGLRLRKALLETPVLAEIITDPRGTQARVRGNRRYGRYLAPPDGRFYYRIHEESEARSLPHAGPAIAFEDIVEPLGFALPYDEHGNRLKNPLGKDDGFEWIHPAVAGVDLS